MSKISCRGKMCVDEDTGRVFFLPDPECSSSEMAQVKLSAIDRGVGFANPVNKPAPEKEEEKKDKEVDKEVAEEEDKDEEDDDDKEDDKDEDDDKEDK